MSSTSGELRIDVLTGREVIIAEGRNRRPIRTASPRGLSFENDPFLEGSEQETPDELLALRRIESAANGPGWLVRAVPNRYPAVTSMSIDDSPRSARDFSSSTQVTGSHEVVVECPDPRSRLGELTVAEFTRVLQLWQHRVRHLTVTAPDNGIRSISIFRNEGAAAGASLPHCHSQIIASSIVPAQLRRRVDAAIEFHSTHGSSLFDFWLTSETTSGERIIWQSGDLVAVCPFASRTAWQVRLCPALSKESDFGALTEIQLSQIARSLLQLWSGINYLIGPFAHNLTLVIPPVADNSFPWMLDLIPRISQFAGFEIMTDVDIVTVSPESAAAQLRNVSSPVSDDFENAEGICPDGYMWR